MIRMSTIECVSVSVCVICHMSYVICHMSSKLNSNPLPLRLVRPAPHSAGSTVRADPLSHSHAPTVCMCVCICMCVYMCISVGSTVRAAPLSHSLAPTVGTVGTVGTVVGTVVDGGVNTHIQMGGLIHTRTSSICESWSETCITIIDTMYHNNRHNYTPYTAYTH
jgi:hypothetical protein